MPPESSAHSWSSAYQHAQVEADVVGAVIEGVHEVCVAEARRDGNEQDPERFHHEPG